METREEAKKQKQWFEDQLASKNKLAKKTEQQLKDKIHHLEDIQAREATLWVDMKLQYKPRAQGNMEKINFLKTSLDELWTKNEMGAERIRTLLHSHRGRFLRQM